MNVWKTYTMTGGGRDGPWLEATSPVANRFGVAPVDPGTTDLLATSGES
jgi:hypothetical protein